MGRLRKLRPGLNCRLGPSGLNFLPELRVAQVPGLPGLLEPLGDLGAQDSLRSLETLVEQHL
eukprot:9524863-Alexandrium_andersonii.AAC.1